MKRFLAAIALAAATTTSAFAQDASTEMTKEALSQYLMQENIEYDVEMATEEQLRAIQAVMASEDKAKMLSEVTAILEIADE